MLGTHLSRWTLAWFGSALVFLLASCCLALFGGVGQADWSGGAGLALVHLFALGWLCQVMLGALIQFVPVLAAHPLALPVLALPALIATSLGTAGLAAGFLFLDGHDALGPLFLTGPAALALGFTLVAVMVGATLLTPARLRLEGVGLVVLAFAALGGLWVSGAAMVLTLSGSGVMVDLGQTLPLHMLFGIGGWLSVAAFGVSYKLFAMFLLAPEQGGILRKAVFFMANAAVALLLTALVLVFTGRSAGWALAIVVGLIPLNAGLYLAEIARLWRSRRRPLPEPNMLWSRAALIFLGLAAVIALPGWYRGGVWAETAVFVAIVGWLSTLTLAQMVKIVSFLTWIQIFAPRIGRQPIPMVQKLTDAKATGWCLALWSAGTFAGAVSLLLASPLCFRFAAALLTLGAFGIIRELIAIRHLSHLAPTERPAALPHLILPFNPTRQPAESHP
ncbi:hypothetical protein [Paracoccus pacificus]|uniref:Transmembrane protein n=1 Tax=Paracoccus pacificus TaxID=1463598 RepID=A0ABW4R6W6_9RHOB